MNTNITKEIFDINTNLDMIIKASISLAIAITIRLNRQYPALPVAKAAV